MTLKEIAAMFKPGTKWRKTNTAIPAAFPDMRTHVIRITRGGTQELTYDGSHWLTLPPAHAVIEARDGFLSYYRDFENPTPDSTVTLERVA